MERYIRDNVEKDLDEKMVFISGPRQVGKTTLSLSFLKNGDEEHPAYLNWDFPETRPSIIKGNLPSDQDLIIFDEIHKYRNWRNLIKGYYDRYKNRIRFIVTGSAKLDYYRRGGDSLQGRYHFWRLHPLSFSEIGKYLDSEDINHLMKFGGFPEPFLRGSEISWRRWQRERITRVIHEDLVSLENVKEVSTISLLVQLLPEKVGSPLSIKSLKEDLNVAHETVENWIRILENLYVCYRILPYGSKNIRAVKKEKKLYLWDWSLCISNGPRFENMVASHLLKYCHFVEDSEGYAMELKYIRDIDKREIDFVVVRDGKPQFAVECKSGEKEISKNIKYFSKRMSIPVFYQVHLGKKDYENKEYLVRVLPFQTFCKVLKLP